MISTSSASVLPKSLQLITNAWAYEIAFSLYTYTHANCFTRIEISSNKEQRQLRQGKHLLMQRGDVTVGTYKEVKLAS